MTEIGKKKGETKTYLYVASQPLSTHYIITSSLTNDIEGDILLHGKSHVT